MAGEGREGEGRGGRGASTGRGGRNRIGKREEWAVMCLRLGEGKLWMYW